MARSTIFTLNARDNIALEIARDHFRLSPAVMFREIQGSHQELVRVLASKRINYARLKNALIPQTDRYEIALFFDRTSIDERIHAYGNEIHRRVLPLFPRDSVNSVLDGDYISGPNVQQQALYDAFVEKIALARDYIFRYSNELYIIYINNLTEQMVLDFHNGLNGWPPYVGIADLSFGCMLKYYLSTILPSAYLKLGNTMIMEHEDDVSNNENRNLPGYPIEDLGYKVRSIQAMLHGIFLDYKIERPAVLGGETDAEISLNAIHERPLAPSQLEIVIDDRKFGYLSREKAGTLRRIGVTDDAAGQVQLTRMIRERISSNYIYNLTIDPQYGLSQFNIVLEARPEGFPPARYLAALKYNADESRLHLVTLF